MNYGVWEKKDGPNRSQAGIEAIEYRTDFLVLAGTASCSRQTRPADTFDEHELKYSGLPLTSSSSDGGFSLELMG